MHSDCHVREDSKALAAARARKDQVAAVKIEPQRVAIIAMRPRHLTTSKLKREL
jgi:hypothetical protein